MDNPIQVEALTKSYGSFPAVKGIDFEVRAGEVFGMLGPNGAGKTTTVEILEGLAHAQRRTRQRAGLRPRSADPPAQGPRRRLPAGHQPAGEAQSPRGHGAVRRLLHAHGGWHAAAEAPATLGEARHRSTRKLSGGQKQRLALALALLNDPQVLFLDEPSAGLDPQARLEIHELVLALRREQRTILLTTHYIEEAEKLCDRVAIVDEGRIVAIGTPREIQEKALAHSTIEIELRRSAGRCVAAALAASRSGRAWTSGARRFL